MTSEGQRRFRTARANSLCEIGTKRSGLGGRKEPNFVTVVSGPATSGTSLEPTIFARVSDGMRIATEEAFGLVLFRYEDSDELTDLIEGANDTPVAWSPPSGLGIGPRRTG